MVKLYIAFCLAVGAGLVFYSYRGDYPTYGIFSGEGSRSSGHHAGSGGYYHGYHAK